MTIYPERPWCRFWKLAYSISRSYSEWASYLDPFVYCGPSRISAREWLNWWRHPSCSWSLLSQRVGWFDVSLCHIHCLADFVWVVLRWASCLSRNLHLCSGSGAYRSVSTLQAETLCLERFTTSCLGCLPSCRFSWLEDETAHVRLLLHGHSHRTLSSLSFGNQQTLVEPVTHTLCHQQNQNPIPNLAQYLAQKIRSKHVSNFYLLPSWIEMNIYEESFCFCQNVTPHQGCSKLKLSPIITINYWASNSYGTAAFWLLMGILIALK